MINRSYLQQASMIESQQPRKKQPMIGIFTKSPLRDRQNYMNLANTPNRMGPKSSLSPLRSRRTQSSITNRSNFNRKRNEPICNNDHKPAKYTTITEKGTLFFCEKCAILLASQGFSVSKFIGNESFETDNSRKKEIDDFLAELQAVMSSLGKKHQSIDLEVKRNLQAFHQQEAKVQEYYNHFYEIIDQYKRRVLEELKQEYTQSIKSGNQSKILLQSAIVDSKRMKDDIIESMNIILNESDEDQYRPIMDNYKSNLKDYKGLTVKVQVQPQSMKKLDFKDPEIASNALERELQIHWQQKRQIMCSKQSDCLENPIEVIDSDQKFTKSSLKEIGNLFSSFDQ